MVFLSVRTEKSNRGTYYKTRKNLSVLRVLLTLRQQSLAAEEIRKSSWEEVAFKLDLEGHNFNGKKFQFNC